MPKVKTPINEKSLTKGQIRKLNALRKSIGTDLGNEAFAKWYSMQSKVEEPSDPNIDMIANALKPLADKLRIPRGGAYAVRRGRGRFIVEAVSLKS